MPQNIAETEKANDERNSILFTKNAAAREDSRKVNLTDDCNPSVILNT